MFGNNKKQNKTLQSFVLVLAHRKEVIGIMSTGDKAIFRGAKLNRGRGKTSIGSAWRHQEFHEKSADIMHPELSHKNASKCYIASYDLLRKKISQIITAHNKRADKQREEMMAKGITKNLPRRLRKDAAVACECIFTFSPEMANKIPIKEWVRANQAFIKQEFTSKGATPVRIDLHMDESCPHLHFMFLPTTKDGRLSAKEFLGGAGNLSKMQDRYADAMEQFGLTRGFSRYNQYQSVMNMAVKNGYEQSSEGVRKFCIDHDIPIPERRRHQSKHQWVAKLEDRINDLQSQKKEIERQLKIAEDNLDEALQINLQRQLNEYKARCEHLESFVQSKDMKPLWDAWNLMNKAKSHHKAMDDDDLFNSLE